MFLTIPAESIREGLAVHRYGLGDELWLITLVDGPEVQLAKVGGKDTKIMTRWDFERMGYGLDI